MTAHKGIFVVAGKGGTGKTTFSGLLVKYLSQTANNPILAIDADPAVSLADLLGMDVEETLGDIREDALNNSEKIPGGMSKHEYFDFMIQSSIAESQKVDLLTMGRPEGPGCYCYVNSILRRCVDGLSDKYGSVVVDCEAGLEHLSRRTTVNIDYLFIITNVSVKGVKTGNTILDLMESLKTTAGKKILVFNRIKNDEEEGVIEEIKKYIDISKLDYTGRLPEDKKVFDMEMRGESIISLPDDSPVFLSFTEIMNNL